MATLTFTAGQLTSEIEASNAKAAVAFKNAAKLRGYEGDIEDNQAVADFVMGELRKVLTDWSIAQQERNDVRAAKVNARKNEGIRFAR